MSCLLHSCVCSSKAWLPIPAVMKRLSLRSFEERIISSNWPLTFRISPVDNVSLAILSLRLILTLYHFRSHLSSSLIYFKPDTYRSLPSFLFCSLLLSSHSELSRSWRSTLLLQMKILSLLFQALPPHLFPPTPSPPSNQHRLALPYTPPIRLHLSSFF